MKIIGTLEEISSATISETVVECGVYHEGFEALGRSLEAGVRLLSVMVER